MTSKTEKLKNIPRLPRAKIVGYLALLVSMALAGLLIYSIFIMGKDFYSVNNLNLDVLNNYTFFALSVPVILVTFFVIATGFWIGWTILTIKVVPPMEELVEKRDFSKLKAFFLCLVTLSLAGLLMYGIYIRNYWAIAIPATVISIIILGAIFWVGIAIITTRSTLPKKEES